MVRNPFKRAVAVPAPVLDAAPLEKGEKVLAALVARDGTWLLGTRDALVITGPIATRIAWQRVERADWDRDEESLKVSEVGEFGRPRPEYAFGIDDPGLLLELIRERVTASVVLQRHVRVAGRQGLFVVARRAPRGDGEISWAYEFDPGVDPDDPVVMAAAQRGLDAAAEELGG
ncbi:MAG TPA: hypothetical protein VFG63_10715 [Nocardioidaceae bacterium]|nr:hypothetical protein [Nocardioidaceae bacterium]